MNQHNEDIPYGPIRMAMETLLGRSIIYMLAIALGSGVGSMIAGGESGSLISGIIQAPVIIFSSIFFSHGLWVWPIIILLLGVYLKLELPHWIIVIPITASILIAFDVVTYTNKKIEESTTYQVRK